VHRHGQHGATLCKYGADQTAPSTDPSDHGYFQEIICDGLGLSKRHLVPLPPHIQTTEGFLQYEDDTNVRYMKGIRTSWVPSAQSIPVHAYAILLKEAWIITSQPALLPPDPRATITSTFEDYLATLSDWDKSLYDGLLMEVSCHEILNLLPPAQVSVDTTHAAPYTLLVSDDESMSFGWVLSLHDGTVLAQCSGPAPGHESSFRSEGYGMLSTVRFLQHIFEYCHEIGAGPFRFITDNQGLIRRVMTSLVYDDPYPNSTLAADWDVVNEIVTTLKKMPIEHSFQHVKGHQDDKILYADIPLGAKLNVDADAEAGEYRYYNPEP
jgi:hypothetical protein